MTSGGNVAGRVHEPSLKSMRSHTAKGETWGKSGINILLFSMQLDFQCIHKHLTDNVDNVQVHVLNEFVSAFDDSVIVFLSLAQALLSFPSP